MYRVHRNLSYYFELQVQVHDVARIVCNTSKEGIRTLRVLDRDATSTRITRSLTPESQVLGMASRSLEASQVSIGPDVQV